MNLEAQAAVDSVVEAYEDAHEFAHDCVNAYFEPAKFRRNLNAYVQAARNITFRIQAYKSDIPDFDRWYLPWQQYLKSLPLMAWVVEARNTVTKKHGLRAQSRANFRVTASYMEPTDQVVEVDPETPTPVIFKSILQSVPDEFRPYWSVEINRRWEIDDVPGSEVAAGLTEALRIYRALVNDLIRFLNEGGSPLPLIAALQEPPLDCFGSLPGVRTETFDPASETRILSDARVVKADPKLIKEAAEKFGHVDEGLVSRMHSSDIEVRAQGLFEFAKLVLKRSGIHLPQVFFQRSNGSWGTEMLYYEDKQQKFIAMQRLGDRVKKQGLTAVLLAVEVWVAPMPEDLGTGYITLDDHPDRQEALTVYALNNSGFFRAISSLFVRDEAGNVDRFLNESIEINPKDAAVLWPILRAWGLEPSIEDTRLSDAFGAKQRGPGQADDTN